MPDPKTDFDWRTYQRNLDRSLDNGSISGEEFILRQLGYDVMPYAGEIPQEEFFTRIDQDVHVDVNKVGSHNQIYVEPNVPVCYKTGIVGTVAPIDVKNIKPPYENCLPGFLHEGIFLNKAKPYHFSNIPEFIGFVKLPDGRMSVAQQYIPNTQNIPVEHELHNGKIGLNDTSSEFIYSIFTALEEVASTVDQIYQLGGTINDGEIRSNLRMEIEGDLVKKIWFVDFEGYNDITNQPPKHMRYYPPELSITIDTLLHEAIRSRPENIDQILDHPVNDYMKFVLWGGSNIDNWTKPTTSLEVIKQVNQILKEHPLEEFRPVKYEKIVLENYQRPDKLGGLDD